MAKNINPTKVITGKDTRWSYCNVWDAKSINGGTPKFSVSLIIPKSDEATVRKIKAAIDAAYHDGESNRSLLTSCAQKWPRWISLARRRWDALPVCCPPLRLT